MIESIWDQFVWAIGARQEFENISVAQLAFRTAVVYLIALVLIRFAKRRFMGGYSAFDILIGFVVGSVLARAATGGIGIVTMVIVVGVLIAIHWLLATVSFYWSGFDDAIENTKRDLIVDGVLQEDAMRKSKLTRSDLDQALRDEGHVERIEDVKLACLERDGSITVIPKDE
jgi:uncharacterized membrane protein YcaP (DUF421 family)